jgi:hypothetical protein
MVDIAKLRDLVEAEDPAETERRLAALPEYRPL